MIIKNSIQENHPLPKKQITELDKAYADAASLKYRTDNIRTGLELRCHYSFSGTIEFSL